MTTEMKSSSQAARQQRAVERTSRPDHFSPTKSAIRAAMNCRSGQRLFLQLGSALQNGDADSRHDEHADESHLEAGSEELARVENEQAQRRRT